MWHTCLVLALWGKEWVAEDLVNDVVAVANGQQRPRIDLEEFLAAHLHRPRVDGTS